MKIQDLVQVRRPAYIVPVADEPVRDSADFRAATIRIGIPGENDWRNFLFGAYRDEGESDQSLEMRVRAGLAEHVAESIRTGEWGESA